MIKCVKKNLKRKLFLVGAYSVRYELPVMGEFMGRFKTLAVSRCGREKRRFVKSFLVILYDRGGRTKCFEEEKLNSIIRKRKGHLWSHLLVTFIGCVEEQAWQKHCP
jgi:hypothetical protein